MGELGISGNLKSLVEDAKTSLSSDIRDINLAICGKIKTAKGKISDYLTTKIYNSPTKTLITPHPIRRTVGKLLTNSKLKNIATRTRNKVAELSENLVTVLQNKKFQTLSTSLSSILEKMGIINDLHLKEFPTTEKRNWSFKLTSDNYATFMYLYKNLGLSCLDNFTKEELLDLLNSELLIPFQKITITDYFEKKCERDKNLNNKPFYFTIKGLHQKLQSEILRDLKVVPSSNLSLLFENVSQPFDIDKFHKDHTANRLMLIVNCLIQECNSQEELGPIAQWALSRLNNDDKKALLEILEPPERKTFEEDPSKLKNLEPSAREALKSKFLDTPPQMLWFKEALRESIKEEPKIKQTYSSSEELTSIANCLIQECKSQEGVGPIAQWALSWLNEDDKKALLEILEPPERKTFEEDPSKLENLEPSALEALKSKLLDTPPQMLWFKEALRESIERGPKSVPQEIDKNNPPQWATLVVEILKSTKEVDLISVFERKFGNLFLLSKEQAEGLRTVLKMEINPKDPKATEMVQLYSMLGVELYRNSPDLWAKDIISLLGKFQGDELSKQFVSLFSEEGLFPISQMKDEFKQALRDNITPQMVRLYATISYNLYRDFPDLWAKDIISLLEKFQGDELSKQFDSLFSEKGLFPISQMEDEFKQALRDNITPQMVRLYATISHNLYRNFPDLWAKDITSLLGKLQGDELFGQILSLFSGFGGLFPVNRMDAVTRRAVSDAISERSEPAFNSLKKWLALVNARNTSDE